MRSAGGLALFEIVVGISVILGRFSLGPARGKWVQRGLVQKGGPLWYGSLVRQ